MPYIGQRPATGEANSFKILDDISNYTLTFGSSDIDVSADTITAREHRFVTGQRVTYGNGGGTDPTGLSNGTVYYIIVEDRHTFKLATSASNAVAGTAINITAAGAGAAHTINVAFDGVNTKFKATHTNGTKADISQSGQLMVSVNGVLQQPHDNTTTPTTGYATDHTSTIIFSAAPAAGDQFFGRLIASNFATFDISDNTVDNFTGDGSTSTFTLSKTPPNNESILVTIDGVVQYPDDNAAVRAYTVSENVLDFASAPGNAVEIQVRHIGFAGASTAAVSGFYGRTGNAALKNTDDIVFRNANVGVVTATDIRITGNLTVDGTTTTLDTELVGVDKLEVAANNTTSAGIITQTGTGDILRLYDGTTQAVTVEDGGNVGLGIANPAYLLHLQRYGNTEIILNNTRGSSTGGIGQYDDRLELNSVTNHPLLLKTNSAERLRITSAGLVGIGSQSPAQTLDIMSANPVIRLTDTDPAGVYSQIDGAGGDLILSADGGAGSSSSFISLRVDGTDANAEKLRITSDGNVRIPDSGKFVVGGGDDLKIYHDGSDSIIHQDGTGDLRIRSDNSLEFNTAGEKNAIWCDASGAVKLYYNNSKKLETDTDGIRVGTGGGDNTIIDLYNASYDNGVIQYYNGSIALKTGSSSGDRTFQVHTAGTERLRITSGGNIGIGTVNPQKTLHVNSTSADSFGIVRISGRNRGGQLEFCTDATKTAGIYSPTSSNELVFFTSSSETERLRITSGGDVNIGGNYTQTSAPLCVTTNANDFGMRLMSGSNTVLDILNNDAAGNAEVRGYYNNNSGSRGEGFRLEASGNSFFNGGNFGIGTNGPSEKLHINGSNGVKLRIDCPNDYSNSSSILMSQGRGEIKTSIIASGGNPGGNIVLRTRNNSGTLVDALTVNQFQGVTINSQNGTHALTVGDGGDVKFRVNSVGNIEMGGSFTAGATVHIRDSNNTTQGAAQLKISKGIGAGAAPSSVSRTNCYIHLGGSEWRTGGGGHYVMGLGYTNGETGTGIPAYVGFVETSSSGYTYGDLIFGTRPNYDGTNNPTERLRIDSQGRLGVGVTPKGFHANNKDVIQGSSGYVILGRGTSSLNISQNFYYDSSDAGKYIVTGPATLYNQSNGSHTFYNASSGSADASASQVERFQIQSDGRVSIGAPAANALGALHIHANQGTDTALWIGDSSTNRYLAINEQGSSQNFNHIHTRFNDNAIHAHYILENPYANAAGYGSQIMFRGYNQETSAYLETSNEAANSARATFRIRGRDNHGIDVRSTGEITTTHASNIGYNVSAATSSRGLVYASDDAQRMITSQAQWYIVKSFYPEKSGTVAMQAQMYIKAGPYYFNFRVREEGTDTIVFNAGDNGGYNAYVNPSGQSGNVHNYKTYKWICPLIKAHKRYYLEMAASNAAGTSSPIQSAGQYVYARHFRVYSDSPGTTAASDFIHIQQTMDNSAATNYGGTEYAYYSSSSNRDSLNSLQPFAGTESNFMGWYTMRAYNQYLDVEFNIGYGIMWFAQAYGYLYSSGQVAGSMISGYNYTNNQILNKFSFTQGNRGWYGSYRNSAGNLCLKFDRGSNGYSEGKLAIFLGTQGPTNQDYKILRYRQNDSTSNAF